MGFIGVEKNKVKLDEILRFLEENKLIVVGEPKEIELKTKDGWKNFVLIEVFGFLEGVARVLAKKFSITCFEWGEHTRLGETSAKLWYEAVKIYYPDLSYESVSVLICDSFLDVKVPTDDVRELEGAITILGEKFRIPLKISDVERIVKLGDQAVKKLEKVINAYGLSKILSPGATLALRDFLKEREREKIEIDYQTGFVIKFYKGKLSTTPLQVYLSSLVKDNKVEEALEIWKEMPKTLKTKYFEELESEAKYMEMIGRTSDAEKIKNFLKKVEKSQD